MIVSDQRRMINSILEKRYNRIILDRIRKKIIDENGDDTEILLTKEEDVKTETVNFFSQIFRKHNHSFNSISDEWKRIYDPRDDIDNAIYDNMDSEPTEEEWDEMLISLNLKSAAGISGIGYKLIKNANHLIQTLFQTIAGLCYE